MVEIDHKYVVGFYFGRKGTVILINKLKPEWQKGFLNGIGGHIEDGETPIQAMAREFREETGILAEISWNHYCTMTENTKNGVIYFFRAAGADLKPESVTDEKVKCYNLYDLTTLKTLDNLQWLIPLALDADDKDVTVIYK